MTSLPGNSAGSFICCPFRSLSCWCFHLLRGPSPARHAFRLSSSGTSSAATSLRHSWDHRTERSRRVIHVGITRSPSDAWVAQQLREATPYEQAPKYLICDNDRKFGPYFARVATTSAIELLNTPSHAPRANAICERFLRSVRQECLDHLFILNERQLHRVLKAYLHYFNRARPHQGIKQQLPEPQGGPLAADPDCGKVISFSVLDGLHYDYRKGA